jgi:hypothetical protein
MLARTEKDLIRKVPDEEPLFILRGQDLLAPEIVRAWADAAERAGVRSGKIAGARNLAKEMERWPRRKLPD